jgi:YidC/Oxa1 family membrane protein insertase
MDDQNRNLLLAAALSFVVIFVWLLIFPPEMAPAPETTGTPPGTPSATGPAAVGPATPAPAPLAPNPAMQRAEALAKSGRIPIATGSLAGSISLTGVRIDDLSLTQYRETVDAGSPAVTLLSPTGSAIPYFATFGWLAADPGIATPDADTPWTAEGNATLTPETPVTLVWDNGAGLVFRTGIAIDERYMFTITQSVENLGASTVSLVPYGYIMRRGLPPLINFYIVHEGAIGAFDGTLNETDYDDMAEFEQIGPHGERFSRLSVASNGWLGFTDKNWLTALVPEQGRPFDAVWTYADNAGTPEYRTLVQKPALEVAPGARIESATRLFAGAKEVKTLQGYETALGIPQFEDAVDWGWFFFLTKPIFEVLHWLNAHIGNMGVSIIILTLIVKTLLFPLAWKSYVSMSKMKKLQPEMEKIKQRAGDDRMKMQQEMMALYKKEKLNPAAGCLPILLQIPIFFSLYKVLFVTIEMRHAPFALWIRDLSAPDPTSVLNLFGLLPFAAPDHSSIFGLFSIGVFPIILGVSMWMQQKLNPAPADPTQAAIFAWMPWIFMFMMGTFAAGLVIYWIANNVLTFIQQYAIMRSQGVEVDFFGNVKSSFRRGRKDA